MYIQSICYDNNQARDKTKNICNLHELAKDNNQTKDKTKKKYNSNGLNKNDNQAEDKQKMEDNQTFLHTQQSHQFQINLFKLQKKNKLYKLLSTSKHTSFKTLLKISHAIRLQKRKRQILIMME